MNIVLLIKDFAIGKKFDKSGMPNQSGGERHGLNHAKELIRLGHHVTIMTKKKYWFTKVREVYDGGIDLIRLHGLIRWLEVFLRLLTTHRKTDAFYIIGRPKFSVWAILYAKLTDKPVTLALTGKAEVFNNKQSFEKNYLHLVIIILLQHMKLKKVLLKMLILIQIKYRLFHMVSI